METHTTQPVGVDRGGQLVGAVLMVMGDNDGS